ncbi:MULTISPECIES: hypothetical protein [Paraburkholderia]|jgi:hypothetical protein|uniref:Uncharacterized protein n=1 Tax=Paraburkholderia madseniana TaxID=2599607 RepID=A0A6N6W672_9BURK|nr:MULTISPECIES: hypothetical protein [Paraburkholderia]KAE8755711.1 hypothetical protein FSO04_32900 [Paraburkholderia madseniana]MCX4176077.1 hypothetical protein [Paraburkholderia madseniana]MDQ6464071.1 hypothetical protein [Paraburkholderia madseniana]NPT69482.1 hypothetical protein [Paraburkholderia madseniana]
MKLAKQDGLGAAAGEAVPGVSDGRARFQYSNRPAAWEAVREGGAGAEAASIPMLLRKQQFNFGYHNKMHRKSR